MIRKMPYSRFDLSWNTIVKLRDEARNKEMYNRTRQYQNLPFDFHLKESIKLYNKAIFDNNQANKSYNQDAYEFIKQPADIAYFDPPYFATMSNYGLFYNILDQYIDNSFVYASNAFQDKNAILSDITRLFEQSSHIKIKLMSWNANSIPNIQELKSELEQFGSIIIKEKPHEYKIRMNNRTNLEYLIIVQ